MDIKGTRTEQNLWNAFSGESMARNKYLFFADKARQEGYAEVAELFERMAQNEGVHGKLMYQRLCGIGSTADNLQEAMNGEYGEWTKLYPGYAQTAREEGLDEIAVLFEQISQIEKDHEFRFMSALAGLKRNHPEKESEPVSQEQVVTVDGYRCVFCGAVFDHRPDVCGVCEAIGAFEPTTYRKKVSR
ncbi:MAG: rubrerythrin family protein [Flavonifractor plautii]|nr:rubrerythrin family protein [Flavonifractor plautii]MDU6292293.1 rubrerythrin family protein [Flavonifractor plautii]MDU6344989.1 rubrerythrin family protein [Flavonifractor plautii]